MPESETKKGCACTQGLRNLLQAYAPRKNTLRKVICTECGKVFWTNSSQEYCFDCEHKISAQPVKRKN